MTDSWNQLMQNSKVNLQVSIQLGNDQPLGHIGKLTRCIEQSIAKGLPNFKLLDTQHRKLNPLNVHIKLSSISEVLFLVTYVLTYAKPQLSKAQRISLIKLKFRTNLKYYLNKYQRMLEDFQVIERHQEIPPHEISNYLFHGIEMLEALSFDQLFQHIYLNLKDHLSCQKSFEMALNPGF